MTSFGYNMLGFGGGGGDSSGVFKALTYVGNGNADHAITGAGFIPDLVWIKNRDVVSSNVLTDSTRGTTKHLVTNTEDAEASNSSLVTNFDANGFSLGSDSLGNTNGENYISWNFKKNSEVFDIVSYVGTGSTHTEAHNMSVTPEMIIVKGRDTNGFPWSIYHKELNAGITPEQFFIQFNTSPEVSNSAVWNNTAPTSDVFTVGSALNTNNSGQNYIAYLFASKAEVCKIGSWTGNGSTSGPTVTLDFQPKFLIWKKATDIENWGIVDTTRGWATGSSEAILFANDTFAEATVEDFDVGTKQFTIISGDQRVNTLGANYIFMALA